MAWRDEFERRKQQLKTEIEEEAREVLASVGDLIDFNRELKGNLFTLREEVQKYMTELRVAKGITIGTRLVGAAVTIGGGLATLFTGGAAAPVMAGGIAMTTGGSVVDLFIEKINSEETKTFTNRLRKVAERHDEEARRLKQYMNSFVCLLEECAEKDAQINPSLNVFRAVALVASMVCLTPLVQRYIQTFMSRVWSWFNLSDVQLGLVSKIGTNLFIVLEVTSAVFVIIGCLAEIESLNRPHPVQAKIDKLVDQLDDEINQLKKRKEYC